MAGAPTASGQTPPPDLLNVDNLRQIGLAMHNYESANGRFPGQYAQIDGTPALSWRVLLLPYLDEQALFNAFDLTKSWDDPANLPLLQQMPEVYRSPAQPATDGATRYLAGVGPGTVFEGANGLTLSSITDGTSNTILIGEAAGGVPWTKPQDIPVGPALGAADFGSIVTPGCVPFLFANASVHYLAENTDPQTLRALFLRSDGSVTSELPGCVPVVPEPVTQGLCSLAAAALAARRRRTAELA